MRLELLCVEVEGGVHDALASSRVGRVARLGTRIVIEDEVLKDSLEDFGKIAENGQKLAKIRKQI